MADSSSWQDIELDSLSERELLILAVRGVNTACRQLHNQDKRIRRLEDWRNITAGGLGVVVVMITVLIAVVAALAKLI